MPDLTAPPTRQDPPDQACLAALRQVHRAVADLRRGTPVLLRDAGQTQLVLAAETADAAGLGLFGANAAGPARLLLAPRRAHDLGLAVDEGAAAEVAVALPPGLPDSDWLHAMADPTLPPPTLDALGTAHLVPAPTAAAEAVRLAKIGRLLPAVLVAEAATQPATCLLAVAAAAVHAYPESIATGLRQVAEAAVPLDGAPDARVLAFRPLDGGAEHLAILVGQPESQPEPLVRLHSACLTGDVLGSLRCDCGPQLRAALRRMTEAGGGVLLYLAQEGRGIGLVNKLRAYTIQDRGQDTVDANLSLGWGIDERSFLPAAIMLDRLGIRRIRLLTNNPAKLAALAAHGIEIAGRVPHVSPPNGINDAYLQAKQMRLGHML